MKRSHPQTLNLPRARELQHDAAAPHPDPSMWPVNYDFQFVYMFPIFCFCPLNVLLQTFLNAF